MVVKDGWKKKSNGVGIKSKKVSYGSSTAKNYAKGIDYTKMRIYNLIIR